MKGSTLSIILCLAVALGCVERAPELSPADRERLREFVSTDAPEPEHELDVQFDNGVRLVGYDVTTEEARPGQPFTVTWYWHATQNLDDGWNLFTHIADSTGESRYNQDGVGVVREIYQPGHWESGQYIRDVQEVTLPADWNDPVATFYLGLWNGPHRLRVRSGPSDGDNRAEALELRVAASRSAAAPSPSPAAEADEAPTPVRPPPVLRANRGADITIDGETEEPSWREARTTGPFVNTGDGSGAELEATARVLWDDEHLYVTWQIADDYVQNDLDERDAELWTQDAFEIMVDPDGDGRNYFELQVSPTGQLFDTRYDSRRQPQPTGHTDWNPEVEVAVNVDGTANDDSPDEGWSGEIAIPWSAFGDDQAAPEGGTVWRVNFYVMDKRPADQGMRAVGWSPTMTNDFHVPDRFGRVYFDAPREAEAEQPEAARPNGPDIQIEPTRAAAIREAIRMREAVGERGLRNPPQPRRPIPPAQ